MGWAAERGVGTIESIESSDHGEAIALERELGFSISPVSGTPGLVRLSKRIPVSGPAARTSF